MYICIFVYKYITFNYKSNSSEAIKYYPIFKQYPQLKFKMVLYY